MLRAITRAAALLLGLTFVAPSEAALAIVQHRSQAGAGSITATHLTLTSAPTQGNLVLAFVCINANTFTVNTGWTQAGVSVSDNSASVNFVEAVLYRYVQNGDTATLPIPFSAGGGSFWAYSIAEISGVNGAWANDLQSVSGRYSGASVATISAPQFTTQTAGTMGLLGACKYDAGHSPTFSAGWTSDESGNNSGAYGAWGLADQEAASGTLLSNTTTFTADTNNPTGAVEIVLQTSVPKAPYIRQIGQWVLGNTVDGAYNLSTAPLTGDLDIGFLLINNGTVTPNALSANYTVFDTLNGTSGATIAEYGVYRYVVGGDTSLAKGFFSATTGSAANGITLYELGGVQGTWAADFQASVHAYANPGTSTQATTAQTANSTNALALIGAGQYNSSTAVTTNNSFNVDFNDISSIGWGSFIGASQGKVSSGTSVSSTITYTSTAGPDSYIQALFAGPPAGGHLLPLLGVGK